MRVHLVDTRLIRCTTQGALVAPVPRTKPTATFGLSFHLLLSTVLGVLARAI